MQEQSHNRGNDVGWVNLKKLGELIQTSDDKKKFRERVNGMIACMKANDVLTPSKMKKIEVLEFIKTKF